MSNPRLDALKAMVSQNPADSFLRYGLAMEYRNGGDLEGAVGEFRAIIDANPDYSPAYFHGGQTLERLGRVAEARSMYEKGVEVTRRKGDQHALSEMQGALDLLGQRTFHDSAGFPFTSRLEEHSEVWEWPADWRRSHGIKRTKADPAWVALAGGKSVNVAHLLLRDLPLEFAQRNVLMRRDTGEVLASQRAMLRRLGRPKSGARSAEIYAAQLSQAEAWAPRAAVVPVAGDGYADCVLHPLEVACR